MRLTMRLSMTHTMTLSMTLSMTLTLVIIMAPLASASAMAHFQGTAAPKMPNLDSYACAPPVQLHEADQMVQTFMANLRKFISFTRFSVDEFEWAAEKLDKRLGRIVTLVETATPCLLDKVTFAQHMYEVMMDAVEHLKHGEIQGNKAVLLTHQLIELNETLLALLDDVGVPDPSLPYYEYKIERFSEILRFCEDEFSHLDGLDFRVRYYFEKQRFRASHMLGDLATYQLSQP
ncbi:hypothetical protein JCM33374_g4729 [Metschnikowia sp. JCM 33374]|nr:hypothetical protein JCM33374_g4729 [Metschnikowia sp. JCM 33374]